MIDNDKSDGISLNQTDFKLSDLNLLKDNWDLVLKNKLPTFKEGKGYDKYFTIELVYYQIPRGEDTGILVHRFYDITQNQKSDIKNIFL